MIKRRVSKAISITENTATRVQEVADADFAGNFSLALETLAKDALDGRQRYTEEHNLNRYIALKTFFYLRENFRAREAGLLEKLDGQFLQQCEEMKRALLEEGVDYGPF
ncbi:MAG: hypothetical protein P8104_00100 [Gammaproteobacteria bacterium]